MKNLKFLFPQFISLQLGNLFLCVSGLTTHLNFSQNITFYMIVLIPFSKLYFENRKGVYYGKKNAY